MFDVSVSLIYKTKQGEERNLIPYCSKLEFDMGCRISNLLRWGIVRYHTNFDVLRTLDRSSTELLEIYPLDTPFSLIIKTKTNIVEIPLLCTNIDVIRDNTQRDGLYLHEKLNQPLEWIFVPAYEIFLNRDSQLKELNFFENYITPEKVIQKFIDDDPSFSISQTEVQKRDFTYKIVTGQSSPGTKLPGALKSSFTKQALKGQVQRRLGIISSLLATCNSILDTITNIINTSFSFFNGFIKDVCNKISNLIRGVAQKVRGLLFDILKSLPNAGTLLGPILTVLEVFQQLFQGIIGLVSKIMQPVRSLISGIFRTISTLVGCAEQVVSSVLAIPSALFMGVESVFETVLGIPNTFITAYDSNYKWWSGKTNQLTNLIDDLSIILPQYNWYLPPSLTKNYKLKLNNIWPQTYTSTQISYIPTYTPKPYIFSENVSGNLQQVEEKNIPQEIVNKPIPIENTTEWSEAFGSVTSGQPYMPFVGIEEISSLKNIILTGLPSYPEDISKGVSNELNKTSETIQANNNIPTELKKEFQKVTEKCNNITEKLVDNSVPFEVLVSSPIMGPSGFLSSEVSGVTVSFEKNEQPIPVYKQTKQVVDQIINIVESDPSFPEETKKSLEDLSFNLDLLINSKQSIQSGFSIEDPTYNTAKITEKIFSQEKFKSLSQESSDLISEMKNELVQFVENDLKNEINSQIQDPALKNELLDMADEIISELNDNFSGLPPELTTILEDGQSSEWYNKTVDLAKSYFVDLNKFIDTFTQAILETHALLNDCEQQTVVDLGMFTSVKADPFQVSLIIEHDDYETIGIKEATAKEFPQSKIPRETKYSTIAGTTLGTLSRSLYDLCPCPLVNASSIVYVVDKSEHKVHYRYRVYPGGDKRIDWYLDFSKTSHDLTKGHLGVKSEVIKTVKKPTSLITDLTKSPSKFFETYTKIRLRTDTVVEGNQIYTGLDVPMSDFSKSIFTAETLYVEPKGGPISDSVYNIRCDTPLEFSRAVLQSIGDLSNRLFFDSEEKQDYIMFTEDVDLWPLVWPGDIIEILLYPPVITDFLSGPWLVRSKTLTLDRQGGNVQRVGVTFRLNRIPPRDPKKASSIPQATDIVKKMYGLPWEKKNRLMVNIK